jgi:hypothetical protein
MAPGGGFAPGAAGFAPGGGPGFAPAGGPGFAPAGGPGFAPARRPPRRGGLVVVAAIVAAVVLLGGAGVTGLVLLNNNKSPGGNGPSGNNNGGAGTGGQTGGGSGQNNNGGGTGSAKYPMTVLPEDLCTKVDLGKLATSYEKETQKPSSTRAVNSFVSNATCSIARQHGYDTLSVQLFVLVYADTEQAKTAYTQAHNTAKGADPDLVVLPGVGEEAHASQTITTSANQVATYTIEARDGNLRMTLYGTGTRINTAGWSDQERRQFITDLGEVAKSSIGKLGSR